MDAANVHDPVSIPNDRDSAILPFGGHEAAHTNLASRGLPYDGPGALATTPGASSSDSDDPCAGGSSDFSGRSEMRYDEFILDSPYYFSRDDFLDYYGHLGRVARWERATVHGSDDDAESSDDGADDADGPDEDDEDAVGPHGDADYAAGSDTSADTADGLVGSVAAYDDACRATNPGRAGVPRTCLVCGGAVRSGNSIFDHHLSAAYECTNTPAHAPGVDAAGATSPSAAS